LLAAGWTDDSEDLGVGAERLRDPHGERRVDTQLRVALDDFDPLVLVRLVGVPLLDVVLHPAELLLADERRPTRDRSGHADGARRAAGDARRRCRARGP